VTGRRHLEDPDEQSLRRVSRTVGLQIAIAGAALVIAIVVAAFAFVLSHIRPSRLFSHREATIDIGGLDIIEGAIIIGVVAIAIAAAMSWFATRRAVRPLGEALRLQRAFVANASHELRTPLAVLDARLQALQRRIVPTDPSADTIAELRRDTTILVEIVDDLLEAAERGPDHREETEANPVVELAVDSMRLLAADRGITIGLAATERITVMMPAAGIHRCVVALIDNALKFSPNGSSVDIALRSEGSDAELSVRDRGGGIRGIRQDAIFDRFARGTETGGRPGFGIGLALVRDTVERYGGAIRVVQTGPDGTEIAIRLPRSDGPRRRRRIRRG
jgi:signal transduction histidine kinase